jgi:hypothetical protein
MNVLLEHTALLELQLLYLALLEHIIQSKDKLSASHVHKVNPAESLD